MALNPPPFSSLKPTMITTVCFLKNEINRDVVFSFLPVFPIEIKHRRSKKISIPHQGIVGAIYSARYRYQTRGIKRNSNPNYFPRSICLDIETRNQNVNAKISLTNIQMCGSKTVNVAREACELISEHITNIGDNIIFIQKNPTLLDEVIAFLSAEYKILDETIVFDDEKIIEDLKSKSADFRRIFSFCWRVSMDFSTFDKFEKELRWIPTITWISRPIDSCDSESPYCRNDPIILGDIQKSMINYSYRINFPVKRIELAKLFDDGVFSNSFTSWTDHYVNIKLSVEDTGFVISSKKKKRHTFVVYRTGTVTQSGPSEESMEIAYQMFWKKLEDGYDRIREDTVEDDGS